MLLNDEKDSHGAFSTSGKRSAESNYLILRNIDILDNKKKKNSNEVIINFLRRNNYDNIYYDRNIIKDEDEVDDLDENQIETNEDKIFNINSHKTNNTSDKYNKKRNEQWKNKEDKDNKIIHRDNPENYKYHDRNIKKLKEKKYIREDKTPGPTKYNPKYTYVKSNTLTGPLWNKVTARKPFYKIDNSKIYIDQQPILKNITENNFVDFDRQTERVDFSKVSLSLCSSVKKFNKNYKKRPKTSIVSRRNISTDNMEKEKYFKDEENDDILELEGQMNNAQNIKNINKNRPYSFRPSTAATNSSSRPITSIKSNLNTGTDVLSTELKEDDYSNDSFEEYKKFFMKQIKKKKERGFSASTIKSIKNNKKERPTTSITSTIKQNKNNYKTRTKSANRVQYRNTPKAIDFKKMISREYFERIEDKGKGVIPFSLPNYSLVRERPLTMAIYDRKKLNIKKKKKKEILAIEPSMFYDQNAVLCKINNHYEVKPFYFKNMISRPDSDYDQYGKLKPKCDRNNDPYNKLPYFMKQVHNKMSSNAITEKSLKMSNYSEGKFFNSQTSFWPKKSFNKIVNLNILNSEKFLLRGLNNKDNTINKDYIVKSLKFYNRNYDDLLKENLITRFDNVTYKAIPKYNKINEVELQNFMDEYENMERERKKNKKRKNLYDVDDIIDEEYFDKLK